jgi:hypothetical protein
VVLGGMGKLLVGVPRNGGCLGWAELDRIFARWLDAQALSQRRRAFYQHQIHQLRARYRPQHAAEFGCRVPDQVLQKRWRFLGSVFVALISRALSPRVNRASTSLPSAARDRPRGTNWHEPTVPASY